MTISGKRDTLITKNFLNRQLQSYAMLENQYVWKFSESASSEN